MLLFFVNNFVSYLMVLKYFKRLNDVAPIKNRNTSCIFLRSRYHFEHREQLENLFVRLRITGVKVFLSKYEFVATNVSYLGYWLSPGGILPGSDKLKAARDSKP